MLNLPSITLLASLFALATPAAIAVDVANSETVHAETERGQGGRAGAANGQRVHLLPTPTQSQFPRPWALS
jgi:hypothetical protein